MSDFFCFDDNLFYSDYNGEMEPIDEESIAKAFGKSLRAIRKHRQLSLQDLGKQVQMPHQTLSAYENATRIPSLIQALKIAGFFEISLEKFILCGLDAFPLDITEVDDMTDKHFTPPAGER